MAPRLVNPTPHTPYVYPKLQLPAVKQITLNNPPAPSRPGSAQQIPANTGPAVRAPQVR
jgi:hypothetical protein